VNRIELLLKGESPESLPELLIPESIQAEGLQLK
jgi:hypothetical protein